MEKKELGRTGLKVSIVGLGGLGIIDKYHIEYKSSSEVINFALDSGINFIETGRSYFDSEKRIGAVLKYRRKDCFIATKTMERTKKKALEEIELSLRDLNTDLIDIYQLHDVKDETVFRDVMGEGGAFSALKEAKKQGKIRFIGFSTHQPSMVERLIKTGEFDTIQIPYNPMDAFMFKDGISIANEHKMGIIIMKPFAGGIINDIEAALKFVLAENIATVIPGAQTIAHIKQNIAVTKAPVFTNSEKDKFVKESLKFGTNFCRQCKYCLSVCPQKIPIPDIFKLERFAVTYYMRDWAKEEYLALDKSADLCTKCGKCIERCPYSLDIPNKLSRAHSILTTVSIQERVMGILSRLHLVNITRKSIYFLKNIKQLFFKKNQIS